MKRHPSWRDYQEALKRRAVRKRRGVTIGIGVVLAAALTAAVYGLVAGSFFVVRHFKKPGTVQTAAVKTPASEKDTQLDKQAVRKILEGRLNGDAGEEMYRFSAGSPGYAVATTLNRPLQEYIRKKIDTRFARYTGIVVTQPATGRILAMVGYDKTGSSGNLCAQGRFPAASIFKIITAAAAIERFDFSAKKEIPFNGRKHTLYKSQLKKKTNRYTNWVSLKDAFATSINPIFGKLGALYLKKDILAQYAAEFGFNTGIDFELPLRRSEFTIKDDAYHWAELASGFNRETVITPIHGALIAGTVANGGKLMEPFIIDRITDARGRIVYQGKPTPVRQAISGGTADIVQTLMGETITSGTCRKTFRGYRKDRVLSRLDMGGKTGSIDNAGHDARLDWFVGYAREKAGGRCICVSVLVAHEEFIGTRAAQYGRMIFRQYFSDYFAGKPGPDALGA